MTKNVQFKTVRGYSIYQGTYVDFDSGIHFCEVLGLYNIRKLLRETRDRPPETGGLELEQEPAETGGLELEQGPLETEGLELE